MENSKNTIEISIRIKDENLLDTLFRTIEIESKATEDFERGFVTISKKSDSLVVIIQANDLVATRAFTNSILRLIKTSVDVVNSIQN